MAKQQNAFLPLREYYSHQHSTTQRKSLDLTIDQRNLTAYLFDVSGIWFLVLMKHNIINSSGVSRILTFNMEINSINAINTINNLLLLAFE